MSKAATVESAAATEGLCTQERFGHAYTKGCGGVGGEEVSKAMARGPAAATESRYARVHCQTCVHESTSISCAHPPLLAVVAHAAAVAGCAREVAWSRRKGSRAWGRYTWT